MKIGIVGLPGSGKTTVFNALTGSAAELSAYGASSRDPNLAVVKVPDPRLDTLSAMYKPKKTTPAQIQYVDVAGALSARENKGGTLDDLLRLLRPVDALLHVVRNFERAGEAPTPQKDFEALESELILSDLIIVEKRLERLEQDRKKGRKSDPSEPGLLEKARDILNRGEALRAFPDVASSPVLRGYAFLSAKPCIVLLNSGDDTDMGATSLELPSGVPLLELKGRLEMELAELPPEEAEVFRKDLGLPEPATFQLIRTSHSLLGLISFFTVGPDEVKAWNIRRDTRAQKAAGTIHSDIERGFIRAEVVAYDDLMALKSYTAAQKAGKVRLEGKEYPVKDGDIINFRFNV